LTEKGVFIMANLTVDVRGETCPVPLVEMRKALRKVEAGDTIEIIGTHPASKKEIPMAADALEIKIVSDEQLGNEWKIVLQK
jgi:tRNA 2-thiouridine synthesizing protein A